MKTISVSQKYFLNHLIERMEKIRDTILEVDGVLYNNIDFNNEWNKIRKSYLELDELINAIKR